MTLSGLSFFSLCIQTSVVGAPEPGRRSRSQTPSSAVLHHSAEGRERFNNSGKCLRRNVPHQRGRGQEGWAGIVEMSNAVTNILSFTRCCPQLPVLSKVGTVADKTPNVFYTVPFIIRPAKHYIQNQHCCVSQDLKWGQVFYCWGADELCHLLAKLNSHCFFLSCNLIWLCPRKHFLICGLQKQLCTEAGHYEFSRMNTNESAECSFWSRR